MRKMREALEARRAAEEAAARAAEEARKKEEEEIRAAEEAERLKKEEAERRKEAKKAHREQLKREGKLLTGAALLASLAASCFLYCFLRAFLSAIYLPRSFIAHGCGPPCFLCCIFRVHVVSLPWVSHWRRSLADGCAPCGVVSCTWYVIIQNSHSPAGKAQAEAERMAD